MKIVVDTNIIFSALLNSNGVIGDILFNSDSILEFYSCNYMRYEITKHWKKLKSISKLKEDEILESQFRIYEKISFINEELIPAKIWQQSEKLVANIDIDDTDFVALRKYLKAHIWTGDKELYKGLKKAKYKSVYNTKELLEYRNDKA